MIPQETIDILKGRLADHEDLEERHAALLDDFGKGLHTIAALRLEVIRLKNGKREG